MLRSPLLFAVASTAIASLPAQTCFDTSVGTDLMLTDDSTAQGLPLGFTFNFAGVAYTDICVCSNGYIWFGATSVGGGDYTPTEAELLAGAPRICPLWTDFNPSATGSGHVYYDNTTPGVAKVTWAGVYEFGGTNAVDLQVVFDAASNITITYGSNPSIGGSLGTAVIIGASPGGGAASNLVSFATLPTSFTSNTFAEVIPATGTTPIPYSSFQMVWVPTAPAGYAVANNPCTITTLPGPASSEVVGAGCPAPQGAALYETFSASANPPDLTGLNLSFLPSPPNSYAVLPGISPTYFTGFSNNLMLADDQAIAVTLPFVFPYGTSSVSTIYVSSNGFITLGTTNPGSGCCTGTAAGLLSGPPRIAAWWADLYPPGGGGVYADLDTVSGDFVVSWQAVPEFFSGPPQSCQIALSPSGIFTIRWSNVSAGTHTWLAGYSSGNGTANPGPTDLSTVNGTVINGPQVPLTLAAATGSRPQVGGTFTVTTTNIAPAPNGVFLLLLLSVEIPGVPLGGVLGATNCTAFLALPALYSQVDLPLGAPTFNTAVAIPASPAYYGVSVMSQMLSDDPNANVFGFRISNGLRWNFGL